MRASIAMRINTVFLWTIIWQEKEGERVRECVREWGANTMNRPNGNHPTMVLVSHHHPNTKKRWWCAMWFVCAYIMCMCVIGNIDQMIWFTNIFFLKWEKNESNGGVVPSCPILWHQIYTKGMQMNIEHWLLNVQVFGYFINFFLLMLMLVATRHTRTCTCTYNISSLTFSSDDDNCLLVMKVGDRATKINANQSYRMHWSSKL